MHPFEVVVHEVECHHRGVILQLFLESQTDPLPEMKVIIPIPILQGSPSSLPPPDISIQSNSSSI
jgi:hypothetical protein